jgi:hypothetical protein
MTRRFFRHTAAFALAATAFLGACQSVEADPEPDVASIRLTVGASTVTVLNNSAGTQTPGPLALQANQSNILTVRFLDPTGAVDAVVAEHADDFELQVVTPAGWTFSQSSSAGGVFTGTLTPTTSGAQQMTVKLWHTGEGHAEVEQQVQLNVAP